MPAIAGSAGHPFVRYSCECWISRSTSATAVLTTDSSSTRAHTRGERGHKLDGALVGGRGRREQQVEGRPLRPCLAVWSQEVDGVSRYAEAAQHARLVLIRSSMAGAHKALHDTHNRAHRSDSASARHNT